MQQSDRLRLRETFDEVAQAYDRVRPDYPEPLFDDLVQLSALPPGADVLEVGCGTGKATRQLARRGYPMTCLEPGPNLAAVARANLAAFSDVNVVTSSFETWDAAGARFGLVFAATSWHWVDPDLRYLKAADLLEPGGSLAVWGATLAFPAGFDPIFTEMQQVYDQIGEPWEGDWPPPTPEHVPDLTAEIEASGRFEPAHVRRYVWQQQYDAGEYVALLDTFSGHRDMDPASRDRLYGEIRLLIAQRGGRVTRHWLSILHVARVRGVD